MRLPSAAITCLGALLSVSPFLAGSDDAQRSAPDEPVVEQQQAEPSEGEDDWSVALRPWKGDYDGMVGRRMVRILVPYSMTHFFLDGATQRGIVAALGRELEREINRREGLRTRLVHVVFIPTPRHQLIPWLIDGIGDIAAGGLTITESRQAVVDFSEPLFRDSREVVCTGPGAPAIGGLEDLAGRKVYVQASSSHYQSLAGLDQTFRDKGHPPIGIESMDDRLEPDEILEMVGAGLVPITVGDQHLAEFWARIFPDLAVHPDLVVAAGRDIAWAFRKDSPRLKEVLNPFLRSRRHRTEFGNILFRRYLQSVRWVRNANATVDRERFERAKPLFEQYGRKYDLDPLLIAALGYQESRLDQRIRSPAGAIGVMQLLPATGARMGVGDIAELEPNIHAGARYLRRLMDRVAGPKVDRLNRTFFALASYNGGQTRIERLRRETGAKGLDPNVWFDNVEVLVARVIGRETVQFVSNVYKYHLAFRLIEQTRGEREGRAAGR